MTVSVDVTNMGTRASKEVIQLYADPKGKTVLEQAMAEQAQGDGSVVSDEMLAATMEAMPFRQLASFVPSVTRTALKPLIAALNS